MATLSEVEVRAHAARLIAEHNTEFEFCLVYEDEDLSEATEADWKAVHAAMYAAIVKVEWPD